MNIISKLNTDIVSINKEDEPLIYISEEAIYLKRNNDKLKQEIERLNNIIREVSKELKEFNEEYLVSEGDHCVYRYLNDLIDKLNEMEKE